MTNYATAPDKSTAVRPTYIRLGTDDLDRHHVYRTDDETIHVVHPDRGRERVECIGARSVDEWMAFVHERAGWAKRDYGTGLMAAASRALQP